MSDDIKLDMQAIERIGAAVDAALIFSARATALKVDAAKEDCGAALEWCRVVNGVEYIDSDGAGTAESKLFSTEYRERHKAATGSTDEAARSALRDVVAIARRLIVGNLVQYVDGQLSVEPDLTKAALFIRANGGKVAARKAAEGTTTRGKAKAKAKAVKAGAAPVVTDRVTTSAVSALNGLAAMMVGSSTDANKLILKPGMQAQSFVAAFNTLARAIRSANIEADH